MDNIFHDNNNFNKVLQSGVSLGSDRLEEKSTADSSPTKTRIRFSGVAKRCYKKQKTDRRECRLKRLGLLFATGSKLMARKDVSKVGCKNALGRNITLPACQKIAGIRDLGSLIEDPMPRRQKISSESRLEELS